MTSTTADLESTYLRLRMAQAALTTPTPCEADPEAFTSDDRHEREEAAEACAHCPLLAPCGAYAELADEGWHVWAGVDRTPRPKPRRRR